MTAVLITLGWLCALTGLVWASVAYGPSMALRLGADETPSGAVSALFAAVNWLVRMGPLVAVFSAQEKLTGSARQE